MSDWSKLTPRAPPQPMWQTHPVQIHPPGCICPPTSEQTCQSPTCPRKGIKPQAGTAIRP